MRRTGTIPIIVLALLGAADVQAEEPQAWASRTKGSDGRIPPAADTFTQSAVSVAPKVIWLVLEGITLSQGQDDSLTDTSAICGGVFPAYGEGQVRDAMLQALEADWEPYNVKMTTDRPTEPSYTTAVVSNVPQTTCGVNSPNVYGVAPMDCGDDENNIVFAFHDVNDGLGAQLHATVISQEIAHSYGLDHVQNNDGIMNPSPTGGDQWFNEGCKPNVGAVFCTEQHAQFCGGDGLTQDSDAELMAILGPREADLSPPTVQITAPAEDTAFDLGETIEVTVTAVDDVGLDEVRLEIDGVSYGSPMNASPYAWSVTGLEDGLHTLIAHAADGGGNTTASDDVTIEVGTAGEFPLGSTGGTGNNDPMSDGDGDGDGNPDAASSGPDPGPTLPADDPDADAGCGCTQSAPCLTGAFWLFPLALRRRRRSRAVA